jgi:hypothetical protein
MNNQQTGLDYYSKEIGKLISDLVSGKISGKQFVMLEKKLLEHSKQMEKELMCQFAYKCHNHYKVYGDFNIEEYYKEKYE